ncbi:hypothetical protein [Evansella tamaricis]|uniref:Uncharacterized protein n=1 Tax=Evansella tamaricis TaxID=2069301 RepID=A0ABS6JMK2_9BACI|nr:hypothetical protein [Evansella tamaricis]MBU9714910.1 hypothetical protein [Evansella tamaricis]
MRHITISKLGFLLTSTVLLLLTSVACTGDQFSGSDQDQGEAGNKVTVTDEMNELISKYIVEYYEDKFFPTEKQFEAHHVYGAAVIDDTVEVYMKSLYLGFNRATGEEAQSGRSGPLLIKLKEDNGSYTFDGLREPMDGSYYLESIKEMFPREYADQAIHDEGEQDQLEDEILKKIAAWLEESET